MADSRYLARLTLALAGIVLVYLIGSHGISTGSVTRMVLALGFAGLVSKVVEAGIAHFKQREKHALQGAKAEESVGAILDLLPNMHLVQHDVPATYGNIDHFVIRKDGAVFLIETKSHSGRVTERDGLLFLNGMQPEKNFTAQVQRNVAWLKADLKNRFGVAPWINAVLVFTNAQVPAFCKIGHVDVIHVSYLERWMKKAPGQPELARRICASR